MLLTFELPAQTHVLTGILDKNRIKIDRRHAAHVLQNDPGPKGVGTTDLQHMPATAEYPGDELVPRQLEEQPARVVVPRLIAHQPQRSESRRIPELQAPLVLRLARLLCFRHINTLTSLIVAKRLNRGRIGIRGKEPGRWGAPAQRADKLSRVAISGRIVLHAGKVSSRTAPRLGVFQCAIAAEMIVGIIGDTVTLRQGKEMALTLGEQSEHFGPRQDLSRRDSSIKAQGETRRVSRTLSLPWVSGSDARESRRDGPNPSPNGTRRVGRVRGIVLKLDSF